MKKLKKPLTWEKLFQLLESEISLHPSRATIERVITEWGSPEQLETWEHARNVGGSDLPAGYLLDYAADCRMRVVDMLASARRLALMSGKGEDFLRIHELQKSETAIESTHMPKIHMVVPKIVAGPQPKILPQPQAEKSPVDE